LSDLAQALKDHPEWRVRIEGYTDNVGNKAVNLRLSRERAESVRRWLMDRGISSDRLSARGYGESAPVGDNSTPDGRARNRRVEIVRIDAKPPTD
jgi:OOP family OmpA-OmpF porin